MDGINWGGLAQQRNVFADLADGLQYGSQMRQQRQKADQLAARQKAYNLFATDPMGAEKALIAAGDIEGAQSLRSRREGDDTKFRRGMLGMMVQNGDLDEARQKAVQVGEFDYAEKIATMSKEQRALAREQAEDLAGFVQGISHLPPEKQKEVIVQARPLLLAKGIPAEKIDGYVPSPENSAAIVAAAMKLSEALAEADRRADNERAERQAKETERHHKEVEGQGRARVAVARDNAARGWAVYRARKEANGFGTPGVGGVVADDDVEIDP